MLVLSRQKEQSIMIGDDVEITIIDVRGDKVRLGIAAPKGITVHRKEVWEAIQKEKEIKKAGEEGREVEQKDNSLFGKLFNKKEIKSWSN